MAYQSREEMLDILITRNTPMAFSKFLSLAHRVGDAATIRQLIETPRFTHVAIWTEDAPRPSGRYFAGQMIGDSTSPAYRMNHPASRFISWVKAPDSNTRPPAPDLTPRPPQAHHPDALAHMLS